MWPKKMTPRWQSPGRSNNNKNNNHNHNSISSSSNSQITATIAPMKGNFRGNN